MCTAYGREQMNRRTDELIGRTEERKNFLGHGRHGGYGNYGGVLLHINFAINILRFICSVLLFICSVHLFVCSSVHLFPAVGRTPSVFELTRKQKIPQRDSYSRKPIIVLIINIIRIRSVISCCDIG